MIKQITISTLVAIAFTGCFWSEPDCSPSIRPNVHFPTFDTTGLEKKDNTITIGYPTTSTEGEELIIYKKLDDDKRNYNSMLNVRDFNSLLESIEDFNYKLKLIEVKYNKENNEPSK